MLDIRYSAKFKKDSKNCIKRNYNMELLQEVIAILLIPAPLPPKYKDHRLTGEYSGYRECHIQPDWLLIYRVVGNVLQVFRMGTHADLFGK